MWSTSISSLSYWVTLNVFPVSSLLTTPCKLLKGTFHYSETSVSSIATSRTLKTIVSYVTDKTTAFYLRHYLYPKFHCNFKSFAINFLALIFFT